MMAGYLLYAAASVRTDKFEVNCEAVVSLVRWPLKSLIIHYELLHCSPLLSTTYLFVIYDQLPLCLFSYVKLCFFHLAHLFFRAAHVHSGAAD